MFRNRFDKKLDYKLYYFKKYDKSRKKLLAMFQGINDHGKIVEENKTISNISQKINLDNVYMQKPAKYAFVDISFHLSMILSSKIERLSMDDKPGPNCRSVS